MYRAVSSWFSAQWDSGGLSSVCGGGSEFYHHFSKRIRSLGRPRSMRDWEMASIIGGGPQR